LCYIFELYIISASDVLNWLPLKLLWKLKSHEYNIITYCKSGHFLKSVRLLQREGNLAVMAGESLSEACNF